MAQFDAIVIGSGVGSLSCAALLAALHGKRVLVLEKHFRVGGFSHAFTRSGFTWDVGLHYVGQMDEGNPQRTLMDLTTGGAVDWRRMPESYDVLHFPHLTVPVAPSYAEHVADLAAAFPHEAGALARYADDLRAADRWHVRAMLGRALPAAARVAVDAASRLDRRGRRLALTTTQDYLDTHINDLRLRAVLGARWADTCQQPTEESFAFHSLIARHYDGGAWFPVGGSDAVVEAMCRQVEAAGGEVRDCTEATSILLEEGRAVGVRAHRRRGRGGVDEEHRAPVVISGAGARATLDRLLPAGVAPRLSEDIDAVGSGVACVTAYLGLRREPTEFGMAGENHWLFDTFDHEVSERTTRELVAGRATGAFLSFPSLKDPTATRPTAEVAAFVEAAFFDRWAGTPWLRRGAEYEDVKERIGAGLLALVERHFPGFGDLVEHVEVSTPRTVETFTGFTSGGFAEVPGTPERLRRILVRARGPVPGLWFTGSSVTCVGVAGAQLAGALTAAAVTGAAGTLRLVRSVLRPARPARPAPRYVTVL